MLIGTYRITLDKRFTRLRTLDHLLDPATSTVDGNLFGTLARFRARSGVTRFQTPMFTAHQLRTPVTTGQQRLLVNRRISELQTRHVFRNQTAMAGSSNPLAASWAWGRMTREVTLVRASVGSRQIAPIGTLLTGILGTMAQLLTHMIPTRKGSAAGTTTRIPWPSVGTRERRHLVPTDTFQLHRDLTWGTREIDQFHLCLGLVERQNRSTISHIFHGTCQNGRMTPVLTRMPAFENLIAHLRTRRTIAHVTSVRNRRIMVTNRRLEALQLAPGRLSPPLLTTRHANRRSPTCTRNSDDDRTRITHAAVTRARALVVFARQGSATRLVTRRTRDPIATLLVAVVPSTVPLFLTLAVTDIRLCTRTHLLPCTTTALLDPRLHTLRTRPLMTALKTLVESAFQRLPTRITAARLIINALDRFKGRLPTGARSLTFGHARCARSLVTNDRTCVFAAIQEFIANFFTLPFRRGARSQRFVLSTCTWLLADLAAWWAEALMANLWAHMEFAGQNCRAYLSTRPTLRSTPPRNGFL